MVMFASTMLVSEVMEIGFSKQFSHGGSVVCSVFVVIGSLVVGS